MESQICLICGESSELKTAETALTIVKKKILFDSCFGLFKINENSYNDTYKWKWDARFDLPSFCDKCTEKIEKLSAFENNIDETKTKIKDILLNSQIIILKSTCDEKRYLYKRDPALLLSNTVSVIDKIDYCRSVSVQNWLPDVYLKRCDEVEETDEGIIDLNPNCLALTNEEIDQFFIVNESSFHCKVCFKVIKQRKNAIRHINEVHKKMKRFQCKFCLQTFTWKWQCKIHQRKDHFDSKADGTPVNVPPVTTSSDDNINCVLCYNYVDDESVKIPCDVFASFSCPSNPSRSKSSKNVFARLTDEFTCCVSCSSYLTEMYNLKLEMKQVKSKLTKLLLELKTDILLSIATNKVTEMTDESHCAAEKISSAKKIEYFRRLAVKDYCPVICLFKMKTELNYGNQECLSGYRSKAQQQRAPTENSVFRLVADEEVISIIMDSTTSGIVPLTDEELLCYYKRDGEKFMCKKCRKRWSFYWGAVSHSNNRHKKIKRFKCKYCSAGFYHRHDCAYHVISFHKMERADIAAEIEKTLKFPSDSITTEDGVIQLNPNPNIRLSKSDIIKLPNKSYQCAICSKIYANRNTVLVHQKKVHLKSYRYKCEFCQFKNHHKHTVVYHIRTMHPDKQNLIDAKNNKPTAQIPLHLVKKLSNKNKKRTVDPSLLLGMKVLEEKTVHKIEEHFTVTGSQFSCKKCGREYTSRYTVMEHIKMTHFGIRRYQCSLCTHKYYSITGCKKHISKKHPGYLESLKKEKSSSLENSGERLPYNIQDDGNNDIPSFPVSGDSEYQNNEEIEVEIPLKLELELDSGSPEGSIDLGEPFVCKTESNVLTVDYDESNNHTNTANVKMEGISNEAAESEEMIIGLDNPEERPKEKCLLYTVIKPGDIIELPKSSDYDKKRKKGLKKVSGGYKCVKCKKFFEKRTVFLQHWGIFHDKSGGYQCSICQRRYYGKFQCARHFISTHTDRSPFICKLCDATFSSNTSLKYHIQKHIGERPFTCSECPLKFITKARLLKHQNNIHMKILGS